MSRLGEPGREEVMAELGFPPNGAVKAVRKQGDVYVLDVTGEVDLNRSVLLRETLLTVLQQKPRTLVVNLSEVGFMDSSGLATLVEALQLSRRYGGKLKLVGVQQRVRSILEISRLDRIFEIYPTEAEALA